MGTLTRADVTILLDEAASKAIQCRRTVCLSCTRIVRASEVIACTENPCPMASMDGRTVYAMARWRYVRNILKRSGIVAATVAATRSRTS